MARNEFYQLYKEVLKSNALTLHGIGFNSNERIILQENLSSSNSEVFR